MSFLDSLFPGAKPKITKKGLGASLLSGGILPPVTSRTTSDALGITKPDVPKIPGVPTVDDAQQNRQETDRIKRRRGIWANIFAGSSAAPPSVGARSLMGG